MFKCTQKIIMKEIVTNTLFGLLIRNHKLRTGSESFINPVKVFKVFLQVKINTFSPFMKKITSAFTTHFFKCFFSLSRSLVIGFSILSKLTNSDRDESLREISPTVPKYIVISFNYQLQIGDKISICHSL